MTSSATVLFERVGAVACVTLNRPDSMNAFDPETLRLLGEHLQAFDADEELRVAVLTGTGDKAFCAGADLKRYTKREATGLAELWSRDQFFRPGGRGLALSKPVIAAINGYCLAGGQELALACDLRIASTNAQFGAPEVRWSLLHGYGALRLPQTVPLAVAMEMLLTGERIDAQRAYEIGLVSRVVPPDQLMPTVMQIAERISANAPLAIKATKELVLRGLHSSPDDAIAYRNAVSALIRSTEDAKEGPRAFSEKRKPRFTGR